MFDLHLPATWASVPVPVGVAYAPVVDIAETGADYDVLPLTLLVQVLDVASTGSASILVNRRIASGRPDVFGAIIGGLRAEGFDYTDGVADLVSWFVSRGPRLVEFQLARRAAGRADERNLRTLGEHLLLGIRWQAPPGGAG